MDGVQFGLLIETHDERAGAFGEVRDDRFVLDVSNDDQPIEADVSALPLQLALLVALGPRPRPSAESAVLVGPALNDASRAALLAAVAPDERASTPLAHDDVMVWTAWTEWPVGDSEVAVRTVSVADAGNGGIALIENTEDGLMIRPCTSAEVWLALTTILPYGYELRDAAVPATPAGP